MNNILLLIVSVVSIWVLFSVGGWLWVFISAKQNALLLKPEEFTNKINTDSGQIIDVRESTTYKRSHIMGARNIAAMNFLQGKSGLRRDREIFLYGDNLRDAARAAKSLKKQGFKKNMIFILRGGFSRYEGKKTN
ncbi:sulfurtransferase [Leuconostoc litchii]|uniref:Rhodanese-like domain-containing protein n=1 Tax=Leuconostoc litchii TaxID=1981069 RepID=A0A652NDQ1_9LACO|nr:rhodanese-like domain-containing protein [Leuconostoc litchii]TYC46029.1 rhodanese-like domain-containing protein [Leuconostoc litchii]GMA70260.1 sulfurtransferase [Leuconostoc litchii]